MTASTGPKTATGLRWTRRHLLGLDDLSAEEITSILDQAEEFKRLDAAGETKFNALAGTVVEVNPALVDAPATVNEDPLGGGWFIRIRLDDSAAADALLDQAAYEKLTA